MSLLIPTEDDYLVAHCDESKAEAEYKEKIVQLNHKDKDGNLEYPWTFEAVKGFFKQMDEETDDLKFNYATENFGRKFEWSEIISKLDHLNETSGDNVSYKLIFFARHGQGFHNLCVQKYGLEAFHAKWHALTTDGEMVFAPDPMLTDVGIQQAKENNQCWKKELELGCPIPSQFYVSPLQRSCYTLLYTWEGIDHGKSPLIVESIREHLKVNLCDKRSPRTVIDERFSKHGFKIEESLTEEDELYGNVHESLCDHSIRCNKFLQKVFEKDVENNKINNAKKHENTFIYTASHGGTIRAFLTVLNHRNFTISTGGMIPIVIKATRNR